MVLVVYKGNHVSEQYQMACMINALTLQQHFMFRPESDTTLEGFKTAFSEIFSQPMPCIKIGDDKLALWNFLNKLTNNDSWKEAMKMWVSDRPWKDILAMIQKL